MIRFERVRDPALVRTAMEPTYRWHTFDGAPAFEDFEPCMSDALYYVGTWDDTQFMGVFEFVALNPVLWEVHTCLLKEAWGRAQEFARAVVAWVFENTPCRHIVTHVPDDNTLAYRLAINAGFTHYCTIPASIQRNGRLQGQFLLGRTA